jgi:hypothetical protein
MLSIRALERASYYSVAVRFIAGNNHPDHDTIAVFRKRFIGHIRPLFLVVLKLALSLPEEPERREMRLAAIAEVKAKIRARVEERE